MRTWVRRAERGYSFIELLIVTTILLILAAGIQPLARVTIQRQKESELRHNLRDIREAVKQQEAPEPERSAEPAESTEPVA